MPRPRRERITKPHYINMANGVDVIDKGGTLYVNTMEKFWEVLNAYTDNLFESPFIIYDFDGHRVEGMYKTYFAWGEEGVINWYVGIYLNKDDMFPDLKFIEKGNPDIWSSAFNMPQYKRDRLKKKVEEALQQITNT